MQCLFHNVVQRSSPCLNWAQSSVGLHALRGDIPRAVELQMPKSFARFTRSRESNRTTQKLSKSGITSPAMPLHLEGMREG